MSHRAKKLIINKYLQFRVQGFNFYHVYHIYTTPHSTPRYNLYTI